MQKLLFGLVSHSAVAHGHGNLKDAALVVVDVQNCFLPGGSLAVKHSDKIIEKINDLLDHRDCFGKIFFSRDHHPANHISFASSHNVSPFSHVGKTGGGLSLTCLKASSGLTKDGACCPTQHIKDDVDCNKYVCSPNDWNYTQGNGDLVENNNACSTCKSNPENCYETSQAMWPDHCQAQVQNDSLISNELKMSGSDEVIFKGTNQFVDAYSAFTDNSKTLKTPLDGKLGNASIKKLFVVGIATDVCVKETVLDALNENVTSGYEVVVISDATEAVWVVDDATQKTLYDGAMDAMKKHGAEVLNTAQVIAQCKKNNHDCCRRNNYDCCRRNNHDCCRRGR